MRAGRKLAIIEEIKPGLKKDNYEICPDRREAIELVLKKAQPNDAARGQRNRRAGTLCHQPAANLHADGGEVVLNALDESARRIVEAAGIPWQGDAPELRVTDAERELAAAKARAFGLGDDERLIGISPGAAFGPSKRWVTERFAEAAALLHRATGMRAIVFLAPGEEALGGEIVRAARSPIISTAVEVLPIGLLKAFMTRCALLLSTDSGTRHIGVALGTPVVTVMGPTDPRYTAYCLERQRVIAREVPCGPCHLRECPTDHRCMTLITPDAVLAAAREMIERYALIAAS